jgi:hypothetical protein
MTEILSRVHASGIVPKPFLTVVFVVTPAGLALIQCETALSHPAADVVTNTTSTSAEAPQPPIYFARPQPKDYTEQDFLTAARLLLNDEELALLANPLASSPEMAKYAELVTRDGTNDLSKARLLFETFEKRAKRKPVQNRQPRTAKGLFDTWWDPDCAFVCQDMTYLIVALARTVGLKAYFVFVEEDSAGERNLHACPAVFLDGRALLVDPIYGSLGAAHRQFSILDDLQTSGLHIATSDSLPACIAACKLAPSVSLVQANLFFRFANEGHWDSGRAQVMVMDRLSPQAPFTYLAHAMISYHDGRTQEALSWAERSVANAPRTDMTLDMLGFLNLRLGRLDQAQDAYEKEFEFAYGQRSAQKARIGLTNVMNARAAAQKPAK